MKTTKFPSFITALMILFTAVTSRAQPNLPTYVAQWGSYGDNGDYLQPAALAYDSSGNLYIEDGLFRQILKIDGNGNVLARWGHAGSGPGALGIQNRGMRVGPDGNLYVTDSKNHRVQVFDPNGTFLSTFGSFCGLNQVGMPGCMDPDGAGPLPLGAGQFSVPTGIDFDSAGNIYVVDAANDRIHKFDSVGTVLATVGTEGIANGQFNNPNGVYVDAADTLYVSETGGNVGGTPRVQRLDTGLNFIDATPWIPNTQIAAFEITSDGASFFVVGPHQVRTYDASGALVTSWGTFSQGTAGTPLPPGTFSTPLFIAYDPSLNQLAVGDTSRVQVFDTNGVFVREWPDLGLVDGKLRLNYEGFSQNSSLGTTPSGDVLVTDYHNARVQTYSATGTFLSRFGSLRGANRLIGLDKDEVARVLDVVQDPVTGNIYTSTVSHYVTVFDAGGTYLRHISPGFDGNDVTKFSNPSGLATDSNGLLYVTNIGANDYVSVRDEFGVHQGSLIVSPTVSQVIAVALDSQDNIYVIGRNNGIIAKYSPWPTPSLIKTWGGFSSTAMDGKFASQSAVDIAVGPNDYVYAIDKANTRVQIFDSDGVFQAAFGAAGSGNGEFADPTGVTLDADGNIYVKDSGNNRIQRFSPFSVLDQCVLDALDLAGLEPDDIAPTYYDALNSACGSGDIVVVPENTTSNGAVKLEPGEILLVGSGATLNGSLNTSAEGEGDNLLIFAGNSTANGKIKDMGELLVVTEQGVFLNGGLINVGSLLITEGAGLEVDGSAEVNDLTMEALSTLSVTGTLTCNVSVDVDPTATLTVGTDACTP